MREGWLAGSCLGLTLTNGYPSSWIFGIFGHTYISAERAIALEDDLSHLIPQNHDIHLHRVLNITITKSTHNSYIYKCEIPWYRAFPRSPFIINISMYFGATEKWHVQMVMVSRVVQLAGASDARLWNTRPPIAQFMQESRLC